MPRRLVHLFLLLFLLAPQPGYPLDVSRHRQIIVAVTDSWGDFRATLYRFELSGGQWRRVGAAIPAVVGRSGLGWDPTLPERGAGEPVKAEGDGRAPAGIFPLPLAMGFSPRPPAGVTLPYRDIGEGTHCVDDRSSRYYNRIVAERELPGTGEATWRSSERMWEMADMYRLLLVVGYNAEEPRAGAGSCIFVHVWRSAGEATAGCTALAGGDLATLMAWLRPESAPALVQLPREAYGRLWREWRLPPPALLTDGGGPGEFPHPSGHRGVR